MISAVCTTFNEADIIGLTLTHLYNEGVANVYIADASTDATREVLSKFPCRVYDDHESCHRQPYWIGRLAQLAYDDGATWVIPFDADEFWIAPGSTLAEALAAVPENVTKLYAQMFHHYTWDLKEAKPKPFPKVAFRARDGVVVRNGNHEADVPGDTLRGVLEVRELQYRSEDHFLRKVRERCATLDPSLPSGEGEHQTRFAAMTDEQVREWWRAEHPFWGAQRDTVHDPIPVSVRCA